MFKKSLLLLVFMLWSNLANALEKVEDNEFKELHDESCLACHIRTHDKDFYTNPDRKIKQYRALGVQVGRCVGAFNVEWFPDEQQGVVDYLNEAYYHYQKPKDDQ